MAGNRNSLVFMVRPERFELPTYWFVASRSIQLSYGRIEKGRTLSIYPTRQGPRNPRNRSNSGLGSFANEGSARWSTAEPMRR